MQKTNQQLPLQNEGLMIGFLYFAFPVRSN